MEYPRCVCRNRRSRQDESPKSICMIDPMPDRIPQEWRKLPFVNQVRGRSIQCKCHIHFKNIQVTNLFANLIKISNAFSNLLASGCLAAPLHTLNQNRSSGLKFEGKNLIQNPISIFCHNGMYYRTFKPICQCNPSLGAIPTRHLAQFRPVTWRNVRCRITNAWWWQSPPTSHSH